MTERCSKCNAILRSPEDDGAGGMCGGCHHRNEMLLAGYPSTKEELEREAEFLRETDECDICDVIVHPGECCECGAVDFR